MRLVGFLLLLFLAGCSTSRPVHFTDAELRQMADDIDRVKLENRLIWNTLHDAGLVPPDR